MRKRTKISPDAARIEVVNEKCCAPLPIDRLFERSAPLEVDLGCGDGTYLTELAQQNTGRNFLGVERLVGRVYSTCRRIARLDLRNVRVIRNEIAVAVADLLPANSVSAFHLLFPDPWPKRKHQGRRVVDAAFLAAIERALVSSGTLTIVTDDLDYFAAITSAADASRLSACSARKDAAAPQSTFERRYRERGIAIHRLLLRKTSDVR